MKGRPFFQNQKTLNLNGKVINLSSPLVLGVLNITPDSFFDGGRYNSLEAAVERASELVEEGADIIDVGAVSTRPGAELIDWQSETERLLPLVGELVSSFPGINISVDTYNSKTARIAVENGACMVNDVSAGEIDPKMFETIADLKVPYIIMHMKGTPKNMQQNPVYDDIFKEIAAFFSQKIARLKELGVHDIIIDPGFGFGKTLDQNYELLRLLPYFKIFDQPLLVGVSRKSMAYKLLNIEPNDALNATTSLNTIALLNGAKILRVHDVREAKEAIAIVEKFTERLSND